MKTLLRARKAMHINEFGGLFVLIVGLLYQEEMYINVTHFLLLFLVHLLKIYLNTCISKIMLKISLFIQTLLRRYDEKK